MTPDTSPPTVESEPAAGPAEVASRAPTRRRKRRKRRKSLPFVLAGLALVFLTMGIVSTKKWPDNLAEPRPFDESDAYWLCKTMIEQVSSDPGKAVIPRVENTGVGGSFRFTWSDSTQFLRLPAHSGLKAAATGSCTVDATEHNVTSLILDGKTLR